MGTLLTKSARTTRPRIRGRAACNMTATTADAAASASTRRSESVKTSMDDVAEPQPTSLSIEALMAEHTKEVERLKELWSADFDGKPPATDGIACAYDDIFFLRYILSFSTADKAISAVRECYKFRCDPDTRRIAQLAKEKRLEELPAIIEAPKWQVAGPMDMDDPGTVLTSQSGRGVAVIIRAGMCDMSAMHDCVTKEEMWDMFLAQREGCFQHCDEETRRTGVLAKQTMLMDMTNTKLGEMMDRRSSSAQSQMSKIAETVYPQLQDKFCIVNAPSWMGWLMAVFRKLASKRAMDKVELFTTSDALWNSDWAKKRLVRSHLPHFIGGGIAEEELPERLSGKMRQNAPPKELTVSARSKREISIPVLVAANVTIAWTVSMLSRGVTMSSVFVAGKEAAEAEEAETDITSSDTSVVLMPAEEIKEDGGPVRGKWPIKGPGKVLVTFDNSHSMLRSKSVRYSFEVMAQSSSVDSCIQEDAAKDFSAQSIAADSSIETGSSFDSH